MPWVFDPHSGGVKIPKAAQERTRQRILDHAEKNYSGRYLSLDIRFRGALCYIDAFKEPHVSADWPPPHWEESREQAIARLRSTPVRLVRLRHFAENRWSVAFYTHSNEKYEPAMFANGTFIGTPEEAFDIGATYLHG